MDPCTICGDTQGDCRCCLPVALKVKVYKSADMWELIVAARKIVLQFNSPVIKDKMTGKQLLAYYELFEVVNKIAPMLKPD